MLAWISAVRASCSGLMRSWTPLPEFFPMSGCIGRLFKQHRELLQQQGVPLDLQVCTAESEICDAEDLENVLVEERNIESCLAAFYVWKAEGLTT